MLFRTLRAGLLGVAVACSLLAARARAADVPIEPGSELTLQHAI